MLRGKSGSLSLSRVMAFAFGVNCLAVAWAGIIAHIVFGRGDLVAIIGMVATLGGFAFGLRGATDIMDYKRDRCVGTDTSLPQR